MKTGIIIQARTNSSRLPGKVLKPLAGKEVLWHVVIKAKESKLADQVVVATSTEASDDPIFELCQQKGFEVFRGEHDNVLKRFYDCASQNQLDMIVRLTADDPLVDGELIDGAIKLFRENEVDYVSNALNRIYPRGLDVEVFSFKILEQSFKEAVSDREKEHVTPYIQNNGRKLAYDVSLEYRGDFRLALDEAADYEFLKMTYDKFYKDGIDTKEVIKYINKHLEMININKQVQQTQAKY